MAKYRKIDTRIWNDEKFNDLSHHEKLVFLFLLTHPNLTPLGGMRASIAGLAAELNMTEKEFSKNLVKPFRNGMVNGFGKVNFVWLPNFLKYNSPANPNVVASYEKWLDDLPECSLKLKLIQSVVNHIETLPKPYGKRLGKPFRNGIPNQELDLDLEQELEQDLKEKICRVENDLSTSKKNKWASSVKEVFDHWVEVLGKNPKQVNLNPKRQKLIIDRLREGYEVETLKLAIDGLALTPWNMGKDPNNSTVYDDFRYFCGDGARVEKMVMTAAHPPLTSAQREEEQYNREVKETAAFIKKSLNLEEEKPNEIDRDRNVHPSLEIDRDTDESKI